MPSSNSPVLTLELSRRWQWGRHRLQRIFWSSQGEWQLRFVNGESMAAVLRSQTWLSPWMICLRWTLANGKGMACLVWRHQLTAQEWHAWTLRLRLQGRPP